MGSSRRANSQASRYSADIDLRGINDPHVLGIGRVPANSRVLDLGLADGSVAAVLNEMGCRVWGVEIDPVAAEAARAFCEDVAIEDLNTIDLAKRFAGQTFDVVLMLDILEHLSDPVSVLKRVAPVLADGGWGVVSLPNVAHVSVRLALLRGRFTYTDVGLLDRTHLRFFDRAGVDDLLARAGWGMFDLVRVNHRFGTTEIHVDDVDPQLVRELEADTEGLTYQFVVSAAPLNSRVLQRPPVLPAAVTQGVARDMLARSETLAADNVVLTADLRAQRQALEAELGGLRHSQQELDDELLRLHRTKLFRWAAPARRAYARIRDGRNHPAPADSRSRSVVDSTMTTASIRASDRPQSAAEANDVAVNEPDESTGRPGITEVATSQDTIAAFEALYQPVEERDVPAQSVREAIVRQFHRLYYHSSEQTWRTTLYRGVSVYKCPLDLWIYQELMHEIRPELIIETGTAHGGSAYYLADVCATLGTGQVITIDIEDLPDRPKHDRITYLTGSSTDPAIVSQVTGLLPEQGPVLVILDSDHTYAHVLAELETYASMVTEGSYLVVEDTNVHGHPALPNYPAGPMEAVERFLAGRAGFVVDTSRERLLMTFNPGGFLRRVDGP